MDNERRIEFRTDVSIDIEINELILSDQYIKLPSPLKSKILNISCAGILLETELNIPIDTCFCIDLFLNEKKISFIIQVIRIDRNNMNNNKYNYGCKFLNIPESLSCKLRKYIYKEQLKIRQYLKH